MRVKIDAQHIKYLLITTYLFSFQSTLLSTLTHTHSEAASYEFTTLTCIPGVIEYRGANIQLLDLPGIIEGAAQGKGRGRQVNIISMCLELNFVYSYYLVSDFWWHQFCKLL